MGVEGILLEGAVDDLREKGHSDAEILEAINKSEDFKQKHYTRVKSMLETICPECEQEMFHNVKEDRFFCPVCE